MPERRRGLGKIVNNQFDREGYALRRFDFKGTPQDPTLYENSRVESYIKLADLVCSAASTCPTTTSCERNWPSPVTRSATRRSKLVEKRKLSHSRNRSDALAMLFWEMDYAKLTAKPEDTSDLPSPTQRRREREEYAGNTWNV